MAALLGRVDIANARLLWKGVVMAASISMYLAEAIAGSRSGYRLGARHAMLIFVADRQRQDLNTQAINAAESRGWSIIELKRSKVLDADLVLILDDSLRGAAEHASANGSALVVYADEVPLDS